jgi:hypothetical protein
MRVDLRALRALAACAVALVLIQFVTDGIVLPRYRARHEMDSHFDLRGPYFGALDLRNGEDPYPVVAARPRTSDRMARRLGIKRMSTLYTPQSLLAYVPLTLVKFRKAKTIFLGISVLAMCASVLMLVRLARWRWTGAGLLLAVVLVAGSSETVRTLAIGQSNLIMLALLVGGLLLVDRRRDVPGGALLALAVLLKPVPAPVFFGLAIRRRWWALLGALAAGAALTAASMLAFGAEVHRSQIAATTELAEIPDAQATNQSLAGAWARLLLSAPQNPDDPLMVRPDLLRPLWSLSVASLLLAALAVSLRFRRVHSPLTLALWLVVGLLAAPRTHSHYMAWLAVAYVPAFATFVRHGRWGGVLALAASFGLVNEPRRVAILAQLMFGLPPCLAHSAQTAGLVLLLILVILAHRHQEPQRPAPPETVAGTAPGPLARLAERLCGRARRHAAPPPFENAGPS